jgi:hypothetical protein
MLVRRELAIEPVRSLAWCGDDLIDWLGGRRISLDGNSQPFGTGDTYRFDAALGLGDLGVVFETLGTKGRIMKWNGELPDAGFIPLGFDELRELDRSYYEAGAYAYPVCLLTLPDGRKAIAHCPKRYDMLEIELVEGKGLTKRKKKPADIFHSRLQSNGRWLLSNGWVWQPWNTIAVYDVARALGEPAHLSGAGIELSLGPAFEGEVDAATLAGDLLIATGSAAEPALAVVELPSGKNVRSLLLSQYAGTRIMPWGAGHILAIDGRPRVFSIETGEIVQQWADVETGRGLPQPSVNLKPPTAPYVAIDPAGPRFAVANGDQLIVIGL